MTRRQHEFQYDFNDAIDIETHAAEGIRIPCPLQRALQGREGPTRATALDTALDTRQVLLK